MTLYIFDFFSQKGNKNLDKKINNFINWFERKSLIEIFYPK